MALAGLVVMFLLKARIPMIAHQARHRPRTKQAPIAVLVQKEARARKADHLRVVRVAVREAVAVPAVPAALAAQAAQVAVREDLLQVVVLLPLLLLIVRAATQAMHEAKSPQDLDMNAPNEAFVPEMNEG